MAVRFAKPSPFPALPNYHRPVKPSILVPRLYLPPSKDTVDEEFDQLCRFLSQSFPPSCISFLRVLSYGICLSRAAEPLKQAICMNWLVNPTGRKDGFCGVGWVVELMNLHPPTGSQIISAGCPRILLNFGSCDDTLDEHETAVGQYVSTTRLDTYLAVALVPSPSLSPRYSLFLDPEGRGPPPSFPQRPRLPPSPCVVHMTDSMR